MEDKLAPTCAHCEQFHGHLTEDADGNKFPEGKLCNNCALISTEQRKLTKDHAKRIAKFRADAEANAKKQYEEELKKINKATVQDVTGESR